MALKGRHARAPLSFGSDFAGSVLLNEPMSRHTSYRIGGNARWFIEVEDTASLIRVLADCDVFEIPWTIIGRGTNVLVSDNGYDGVVICLSGVFSQWTFDRGAMQFRAGAAALLSRIVQEAFREAVSGFEFAVGTPGTVGGAIRMNAGTRTDWIGSRVVSVELCSPDGTLKQLRGDEIIWGYRQSSIPDNDIVVSAVLSVTPDDAPAVRDRMEEVFARRKRTQPFGKPSCGSVFKNPDGQSVAQLIESAGMKGSRVGDAQVSEKHANFIVNLGSARAADVYTLIQNVKDAVKEVHGVELKEEVRFLGF